MFKMNGCWSVIYSSYNTGDGFGWIAPFSVCLEHGKFERLWMEMSWSQDFLDCFVVVSPLLLIARAESGPGSHLCVHLCNLLICHGWLLTCHSSSLTAPHATGAWFLAGSLCYFHYLDLGLFSFPVEPVWISVSEFGLDNCVDFRESLSVWRRVWIFPPLDFPLAALHPVSSPQHCINVYISPGDTFVSKRPFDLSFRVSQAFESCIHKRDRKV